MSLLLNLPRSARVRTGEGGTPVEVDGHAVELVRESWLVEDRWWSERPLRRRYWEVLCTGGRNVVVFHDLAPCAPAHARDAESARRRPDARTRPPGRAGAGGASTPGWFTQGP